MESRTKLNRAVFVTVFILLTVSTLLYGAVHQAVLAFVYFMIALMTVFWACDAFLSGKIRVSREPLQLILFAAALYGLIQTIPYGVVRNVAGVDGVPSTISFDPFATQVNALHFLGLGMFFSIICISFDSASRLKKTTAFITVFGAAYAFFAILQSVLSPTMIYGLLERPLTQPFGSFVSRNNFAAWMELAVAIPLGMLFTGSVSTDKRLIYITAAVLMGVSIVVSGSRGGLISLVLMIGLLLFVSYSRRERSSFGLRIVLGIGILTAIVAGTAFVGGENTLTRISDEQAFDQAHVVTRPQIWSVTIKMISANLPFGVGLGAYGLAYTQYDEASGFERVEQAHSDYLQVLSDAGIVGGVLGIVFLVLCIKAGLRSIRTSNLERRGIATGAFAGIFAVLVHSMFDFVLHTTSIGLLFLTLLGLLIASRSNYKDDAIDPEPGRRRGTRPSSQVPEVKLR